MTIEEINTQLADLEKKKAKLIEAKQVLKNKRFEELSGRVMAALRTLVEEYPRCEWVVEVDTMEGRECINLLARSDLLKENCFSQD